METGRKLKLERFASDFWVTRQIDEFVCLDVTIGTSLTNPSPLYWRLIDPETNLIEIGVERDTGQLLSITIVSYQGALYKLETDPPAITAERLKVPRFCLDLWGKPHGDVYDIKSDYYDVTGRCRLELGENSLRLELFPDLVAYSIALSSDLICEFNPHDELCAVLVNNIKPSERADLERSSSKRFHRA